MIGDLLLGWAEMEEAEPEYREAMRYYDGNPDEFFADPRVARMIAQTGDRYRFNFSKTPVNVLASRISLASITIPGSESATEELNSVLDANDMDVHFPDMFLRALEFGDAYLMAWPMEEVEEDLEGASYADQQLLQAGVEITYHSPINARMIYDGENERRKSFFIRRWAIPDPVHPGEKLWRVDIWYPSVVERWVSVAGEDLATPSGWKVLLEDDQDPEDWLIPNEFGEIPVFHWRTELPYGRPVHRDGYGPQDAINKMLITLLTTTDSHGWPQRYGLIDGAAELDSNSDGPDWTADEDATEEVQGGTGSAERMGPGTMARFTGMTEVGQFDAADPKVFTDPAQMFVRIMAQVTETPFHAFDPSGDVPSGESLKVAEAPLVKRAQRFITMFTSPTIELAMFICRLAKIKATKADIRWAAVESATGLDDWMIIKEKQAAGVPVDQTLQEAGYDPEQVARWLDDQGEAMDLGHRVAILSAIGTAIQSIGSGIALGVVDEAQANAIISDVLAQTVENRGGDPA